MSSDTTPEEPTDEAVIALAQRLFDAARAGETQTLIQYVEAGAPVDLVGASGDSLLMLAAYHGHAATVQALIERGANPELANVKGQTPIAGAVFKGYAEVISVLIAAGANPDAGRPTARETATMFDRPDLLELLARG